jgi:hypothetical protein
VVFQQAQVTYTFALGRNIVESVILAIVFFFFLVGWTIKKAATNEAAKSAGLGLLERWLRR